MEYIRELLGEPSAVKTPKILTSVQRSKVLALGWTAMRIWLGVMWIQAGTAKLWGAENPAFLHNNGAGVAGFASHGVPAYSWWGSFLHSFVVPNSGWIAILVAVSRVRDRCRLGARTLYTRSRPGQFGALVHLRDVGHRECVRVLRTVRHRDPGHMEDLELDWPRRRDLRIPPAPCRKGVGDRSTADDVPAVELQRSHPRQLTTSLP